MAIAAIPHINIAQIILISAVQLLTGILQPNIDNPLTRNIIAKPCHIYRISVFCPIEDMVNEEKLLFCAAINRTEHPRIINNIQQGMLK